jgi:hypothetical protein
VRAYTEARSQDGLKKLSEDAKNFVFE